MCPYCNNGSVITDGKSETCLHCITGEKFITFLDRAIKGCKDQQKLKSLRTVRANLPNFPIMAKLEAENMGLAVKFIDMMVAAFDIKPFVDMSYKKVLNGDY